MLQAAEEACTRADEARETARAFAAAGKRLEAAEWEEVAGQLMEDAFRARAATTQYADAAKRSAHQEAMATEHAEAARQNAEVLTTAVDGIMKAIAAAESSAQLEQRALDDSQAATDADNNIDQICERLRYALQEAEEAEAQADDLSGTGSESASMQAVATAARCGLGNFHQREPEPSRPL